MLVKEKIEQAKKLCREFDADCWVTFVRESQINGDPTLVYLVEADVTWHSAFIITRKGETCAIVGKYDRKSVEDLNAYDEVYSYVEGIKQPLLTYLKKINPSTIAINYSEGSEICDGLTHGMYLTLTSILKESGFDAELVSAEKIVSALRERKSETEINFIREAIQHTLEIFDEMAPYMKPGKTEKQIATFMKDKVRQRQLELAWEETVCPAVFTGPETADAHYMPTDRPVEPGHILNMDFGVKSNGYCSDLQRTFYIKESNTSEVPAEVEKGFTVIRKAIEESRLAMKPGTEGWKIDEIARNIIVENGYEEFPHALGHQVGRFSHDGTALLGPAWEKYARKPFQKLEKGMVFTIEPRLTVPKRGVVTIEEMVMVTEKGAEYLSSPQLELTVIDPE